MSTAAAIISAASKRLAFWNSDYETNVATVDLQEWIKDICSSYPWWFLNVIPGTTTLVPQFPFANLSALTSYSNSIVTTIGLDAGWVDRGWLRTQAGQQRYAIWVPAVPILHDASASNWVQVGISRLQFVKEFDYTGNFQGDLECDQNPNRFGSNANYSSRGKPVAAWFETSSAVTGGVSYINLMPVPDQTYLYQVSYVMRYTPTYTSSGSVASVFMNEYPEVCKYAVMIKACEYFQEDECRKMYEEILWGNPPKGSTIKVHTAEGLIGKMRKDSQTRTRQLSQTMPQYKGGRGAFGRGGQGLIRRRRGWYTD